MKFVELLTEKHVESTWIVDIKYNRRARIATMTLSNGRQYRMDGMTRTVFDKWHASPSKGRFFHQHIKGKYSIPRVA